MSTFHNPNFLQFFFFFYPLECFFGCTAVPRSLISIHVTLNMVYIQTPKVHFPTSDSRSGHLDEIWTVHSKWIMKVEHFWGKFCLTFFDELHRAACQSAGHTSRLCMVPTVRLTADCLFSLLLRRGGGGWDTPWGQVASDTTNRLI